jgi:hypothetical protein
MSQLLDGLVAGGAPLIGEQRETVDAPGERGERGSEAPPPIAELLRFTLEQPAVPDQLQR